MNRRFFLRTAGALSVGAVVAPLVGCNGDDPFDETPAANDRRNGFVLPTAMGIQLYTLREVLSEDLEGTLEELAEIGYEEVETHTLYGREPGELRNILDNVGLRSPAGHYQFDEFRNEMERLLREADELGQEYLVCPWLGQEHRESIDAYLEVADYFNQFGEQCQDAGKTFAYHNHEFEFEEVDGEIPYDVLLEETEEDLVDFELDLYWIVEGGYDPIDYIERYPGRFSLFHVKDRAQDGGQVNVGDGEIPFSEIFDRADEAGLEHAFVEHDQPEDPIEFARQSYYYLSESQ